MSLKDYPRLVLTALMAAPALFSRQVILDIEHVRQTEGISASQVLQESVHINRKTSDAVSQGLQIQAVTLDGEEISLSKKAPPLLPG